MIKVGIKEGESVDRALKRFKRKVEQSGILKEVRKRQYFQKPSIKKKLKARSADARAKKRDKKIFVAKIPKLDLVL